MKITTLLAPTDFSPTAARASSFAADLAASLGARVVLLHVWHVDIPGVFALEGSFAYPPRVFEEAAAEARREAEERARSLAREHGVVVDPVVVGGLAETAILETADEIDADMIVMGTHGRQGFSHLVLGSVAERVVRQSTRPVLTIGPEERDA